MMTFWASVAVVAWCFAVIGGFGLARNKDKAAAIYLSASFAMGVSAFAAIGD